VLLLLDDRYAQEEYDSLLPAHIRPERVQSLPEITQKAKLFWRQSREGGQGHG